MARTAGSDGGRTAAAIREAAVARFGRPGDAGQWSGQRGPEGGGEAAVALIARHGYEAMSMRQLAAEVGVQPAALYRYFPTKEDLLFTLMREHMQALMASWQATRPDAAGPVGLLAAFVDHHIRFHVARRHATHVSNMELRSLSRDRLTQVLRLRTSYEKELRAIGYSMRRDATTTGLGFGVTIASAMTAIATAFGS